jgi:AbrB family looped-hinge helix DNA binding protein
MPLTAKKAKVGVVGSIRAKVTSKGQITLPVALRKRLGVKAGDSVVFREKGNEVVMTPQRDISAFSKYRGMGTPGIGPGKKAVLDWVREIRGEL